MWFSHDDLMGRIWPYRSRVSGCRKTFPSFFSMWNVCKMPYSSAHMHSPPRTFCFFILDVPEMHLEGATAGRHTVCLRQIVLKSEDVVKLSAECLQRTISGNDADIYWQFMCLINQVKTSFVCTRPLFSLVKDICHVCIYSWWKSANSAVTVYRTISKMFLSLLFIYLMKGG